MYKKTTLLKIALNFPSPFEEIGSRFVGFALQGIGQAGCYERGLVWGELVGSGVEEAFSGSFGTIDALSHLGYIQVYFKDTLLAPNFLYEKCEIGLKPFAHPAASGKQEYILGGLLAYSAGSAELFPLLMVLDCLFNLYPVKSVVGVESGILTCHDSFGEIF